MIRASETKGKEAEALWTLGTREDTAVSSATEGAPALVVKRESRGTLRDKSVRAKNGRRRVSFHPRKSSGQEPTEAAGAQTARGMRRTAVTLCSRSVPDDEETTFQLPVGTFVY